MSNSSISYITEFYRGREEAYVPGWVDTYSHIISITHLLLDFAQVLPSYFYLAASHKSLNLRKRRRKTELKRELMLLEPLLGDRHQTGHFATLSHVIFTSNLRT